jgi:low temperature requirement protein LtrA
MARRSRVLIRPTSEGHQVTSLELLFDLVFVFAFTQVTAVMAADPTLRGAARGLVLLALLWWAWCSYAWLGNQARADEGVIRAAMVTAIGAMFIVALAIPEAWGDLGGGFSAPVALAVALGVVRLGHLSVYAIAAAGDAALRRQLALTAYPVSAAVVLLVVGAAIGGAAQTGIWLVALVVDYIGVYAAGTSGWRLRSPRHFAERHGLIIIVALGESIVAIGVGVTALPLTFPVIVAALLGLGVSVALWWAYFDVVALVAERVLADQHGSERARLGRDSYTYLHFPMVAGIIYLALGLKKVLEYVGDTEHHDLTDTLPALGLWAMYGGVAAYLLAHIAFRLRNVGSVNRPRLVVATGLLVLAPLAGQLPALGALAVLAAVLVGLIGYEAVRYAEARDAIRHADSD